MVLVLVWFGGFFALLLNALVCADSVARGTWRPSRSMCQHPAWLVELERGGRHIIDTFWKLFETICLMKGQWAWEPTPQCRGLRHGAGSVEQFLRTQLRKCGLPICSLFMAMKIWGFVGWAKRREMKPLLLACLVCCVWSSWTGHHPSLAVSLWGQFRFLFLLLSRNSTQEDNNWWWGIAIFLGLNQSCWIPVALVAIAKRIYPIAAVVVVSGCFQNFPCVFLFLF